MRRKKVSLLLLVVLVSLSAPGILNAWAAPPRDGRVHVVQPGETLTSIALRYGITVTALIQANGIVNPNWIYVGQKLTIPTAGSAGITASGVYHAVRQGETLYSIAIHYGVSADALAKVNGLSNPDFIYAGQRLLIPQGGPITGRTHVVQRSETLASISLRYGVTISALARANGLHNSNMIYVGQKLHIPTSDSPAVPASTASSTTSKLIEIDISDQRMTVWENGRVKWYWVCSTGEPSRPTRIGQFSVISKITNAYSSTYHLQMPWWLGIYWAGGSQNGIHALPILPNGRTLWAGLLGRRVSFGCIILDTGNARALYNWADIGTPVIIHP